VYALKEEGLGCLPAQDRSAVLNLTMHCRLFMSVDRHAEDTVASISQLIKLVQFDLNYTVAQVSIGRGILPFQARAQNKQKKR